MNKSFFTVLLLIIAVSLAWSEDYPPEGWITDLNEAYQEAQETDRNILINFTGSDWCVWCIKLRDEVFSKEEFLDYAEENLVMLFLDFPSQRRLSTAQQNQNRSIQSIFGVRGYPTLWVVDKDLKPLLFSSGYNPGGPTFYIRHFEEDRTALTEVQINGIQENLLKLVD